MSKIGKVISIGVAAATMCTLAVRAEALTLTPSTAGVIEVDWPTADCPDPPNAGNEELCVANTFGEDVADIDLLYKQNNGGAEAGSFAGSYVTSLTDNGGTITYVSGQPAIDCPSCYLLIKDGDPRPRYLYDLSAWNGTETITLEGFYLSGGAISHVSIYGSAEPCVDCEPPCTENCEPPVVPEPASLLLLGSGLAGLAAATRRRNKKAAQ